MKFRLLSFVKNSKLKIQARCLTVPKIEKFYFDFKLKSSTIHIRRSSCGPIKIKIISQKISDNLPDPYLWLSVVTSLKTVIINVNPTRGRHKKKIWSEPTGTHFLGSDSEPGTHWNPLFGFRLGTRNPLEPIIYLKAGTRNPKEPKYYRLSWVPPGTLEPGTPEPIIWLSKYRLNHKNS